MSVFGANHFPKPANSGGFENNDPFKLMKYPEGENHEFFLRIVSGIQNRRQFQYPSHDMVTAKGKRGSFNLNGRTKGKLLTFADERQKDTPSEGKMISIYKALLDKRLSQAKVRLNEQGITDPKAIEQELKKVSIFPNAHKYCWGELGNVFGFQAFYKGKIEALDCKSETYNPLARTQNQEFQKGLFQLAGEFVTKLDDANKPADFLVNTPFVTEFKFTGRKSINSNKDDNGNPKHWLVYQPEALCPEKFQGILQVPLEGDSWSYIHPDDFPLVQEYYSQLQRGNNPAPPSVRDYPSDDGNLTFVCQSHQASTVNVVNDTTGITAEMVAKLKERKPTFYYAPCSELSLMGGYYYINENEQWVTVDLETAKANTTGKFDEDNNPYCVIDGKTVLVKHHIGLLWKRPLNPTALLANMEYAFPNDSERESIQTMAEKAGIPTLKDVLAGKTPSPYTFKVVTEMPLAEQTKAPDVVADTAEEPNNTTQPAKLVL